MCMCMRMCVCVCVCVYALFPGTPPPPCPGVGGGGRHVNRRKQRLPPRFTAPTLSPQYGAIARESLTGHRETVRPAQRVARRGGPNRFVMACQRFCGDPPVLEDGVVSPNIWKACWIPPNRLNGFTPHPGWTPPRGDGEEGMCHIQNLALLKETRCFDIFGGATHVSDMLHKPVARYTIAGRLLHILGFSHGKARHVLSV